MIWRPKRDIGCSDSDCAGLVTFSPLMFDYNLGYRLKSSHLHLSPTKVGPKWGILALTGFEC